jgi:hypothetical protein
MKAYEGFLTHGNRSAIILGSLLMFRTTVFYYVGIQIFVGIYYSYSILVIVLSIIAVSVFYFRNIKYIGKVGRVGYFIVIGGILLGIVNWIINRYRSRKLAGVCASRVENNQRY